MRKSALYAFGLVVMVLVALGLVTLSTASEANAIRLHGGDAYFFIKRQFMYLAAGVVIVFAVSLLDYRCWRDHPLLAWIGFFTVFALLFAVFGFRAVNGSHRWIMLGPVRIQPSEFAKMFTVIMVSVWLDRCVWRVEQFWRGAMVPAILIGLMCGPILFEPDFGSVMVAGFSGFLVMFVAGVRFLHMLPFAVVGVGVAVFKIATNANRMARLFDDSKLYQVKMALAAIHNGGIYGVGMGQSMQKQAYLPEAHTDFVLAIGAEEFGLFYSIGVILAFACFFGLAVYIAAKAEDRFGRLLVVGMTFIIFFQAMFNLGVVCQALPTKGMALPFFSYGGTNLLSAFFAVGTIMSVGIHSYRDRKREFIRKVIMK